MRVYVSRDGHYKNPSYRVWKRKPVKKGLQYEGQPGHFNVLGLSPQEWERLFKLRIRPGECKRISLEAVVL